MKFLLAQRHNGLIYKDIFYLKGQVKIFNLWRQWQLLKTAV